MGDEQVFEAAEIDVFPQAEFPLRCRWTGVEQHEAAVNFCAVVMNLPYHVGGMYGMLAHG
jgi:hypothetical protein